MYLIVTFLEDTTKPYPLPLDSGIQTLRYLFSGLYGLHVTSVILLFLPQSKGKAGQFPHNGGNNQFLTLTFPLQPFRKRFKQTEPIGNHRRHVKGGFYRPVTQ